jgi:hypothetical protein
MHIRSLFLCFLTVILTVRYCSADTCHPFHDNYRPSLLEDIGESYTIDYCQRGLRNVCCTIESVLNYEQHISRFGVEIPRGGIKTGSKCQQLSRELACHYGCSSNLRVDYNTKTHRFQPLLSLRYIWQFTSECHNSMWCGTWDSPYHNRSSGIGCYTIRKGKIVYNENGHISSKLLSARAFARQVLDARIDGTYADKQDPPAILGTTYEVDVSIKNGMTWLASIVIKIVVIISIVNMFRELWNAEVD